VTLAGATASCLLLTEGAFGSPLHAMRSLRTLGVAVYAATAGTGATILDRSRYCTAAADHDSSSATAYCRAVIDWIDGVQPSGDIVVIPLSDRFVEYLDIGRELFPDRFRLAIPPHDVVGRLVSKDRSLAAAERAGLRVPTWAHVAAEGDIDTAALLSLPVAVRPTSWATAGQSYFKIAVFRDRPALVDGLRARIRGGAQMVAQEYLEVPDDAVEFALLWRSEDRSRTEVVTGRKRRQAGREGGVMVWGEAAPLPDVAAASVGFLDESRFTGLGGIEFIRRTGELWFIEFNPRLEAIHFLAARAGLDTVKLEFEDRTGVRSPQPVVTQAPATAWVGSAWLQRFLDDPGSRRHLVADRWRFARSPRRVRAVWSWRDPVPGLLLSGRVASGAIRRSAGRRSAGRRSAGRRRP
jgi:predicted ATP-grasp superfamily ATP-dependent carboligase